MIGHIVRITLLAGCLTLSMVAGMRLQAEHTAPTIYGRSTAGDLISTQGSTVTTFCALRGQVYAIADASCLDVRLKARSTTR